MRGMALRYVDIHHEDCTLDLEDFRRKLSERTRLMAVAGVSNAVGTINPIYRWITTYERELVSELIGGLGEIPDVRIWGITDRSRYHQRVPTVAITHHRLASREHANRKPDLASVCRIAKRGAPSALHYGPPSERGCGSSG